MRWSASASGTRNTYDQTVNFVSDYGGVGDGSTSNATALSNFNTAYAGFSGRTQLIIPPGDYSLPAGYTFGSTGGNGSKLTISAYGATLRGSAGTNGFGGGYFASATGQAKIVTTSAGTDTVTLVTSGETSLFTTGQWVMISAIDMQGYGDPPNPGIFEFKKIASIGSGTLTFTEPLLYSYKSTYPVYAPGQASGPPITNQGGPATVYPMTVAWDQEIEMKGAYFTDNSNLQYGKCRIARWVDCTFETYGPCPTLCVLYQSIRCTGAGVGGLEVDKCAHRVEFIDSMHRAVDFQSSSINELYVSNMVQTGSNLRWRGGAGRSNIFLNLSTTTFNFNEMNYGAMGPTYMENCTATSSDWFRTVIPFSDLTEEGGGVLSYAGGPGTVSAENSYFFVPGQNCVLVDGSQAWARSFQVTDVSQSAGRTYVTTNLPFPVPGTIDGKSAPWGIASHPCADLTMVNCSGNSMFTAQSLLPAHTPFQEWTL